MTFNNEIKSKQFGFYVHCTVYIFHKMFPDKDKRLANQMYIGMIFEQPEVGFFFA